MSNLIIIGNGFDLQCGLETSYYDFLKHRKSKLDKQIIKIDILCQRDISIIPINVSQLLIDNLVSNFQELTFWDLIFLYYEKRRNFGNIDWFSIEEIIFSVVNIPGRLIKKDVCLSDIEAEYKMIKKIGNGIKFVNDSDVTNLNQVLAILFYFRNGQKVVSNSYTTLGSDLYDFAFQELNRVEDAFVNYLVEMRTGSGYYKTAHKILRYLNDNNESYSLLNFNYTNPTLYLDQKEKTQLICTENVHGDLSSKRIIFGIDHSTIEGRSLDYQFTKTARKIYLKNDTVKQIGNKLLPVKLDRITVYGHSLNSADFSYYQSIFDFYDLYHSEVTLVFYFSDYDKGNIKKIRKVNNDRVMNLILEYGKSLDNKNHGKNLLHKLLLEDRLQIRIINSDFSKMK